MSTDLTLPSPAGVETRTMTDPTGGRLVSWAEAASAANSLARALSQTAFVPKEMTNVGNATAAILMGDELGLSPLAALRSIYVVHGTPALYARSMVALALSQGHEIWTEETSDAKVTVCGRRKGSDHVERAEWTPARARKAGYTGNRKYESNPQEMLYSKAAAEIARKVAPDTLAGIPYSVEDLELEKPATRTITREAKPEGKRTVKRQAAPEPVEPDLEPETPEPVADNPPADDAPKAETKPISDAQMKALQASYRDAGITERDDKLRFASEAVGRDLASAKDLTHAEASTVIDELKALTAPADEAPGFEGMDDAGWAGDDRA